MTLFQNEKWSDIRFFLKTLSLDNIGCSYSNTIMYTLMWVKYQIFELTLISRSNRFPVIPTLFDFLYPTLLRTTCSLHILNRTSNILITHWDRPLYNIPEIFKKSSLTPRCRVYIIDIWERQDVYQRLRNKSINGTPVIVKKARASHRVEGFKNQNRKPKTKIQAQDKQWNELDNTILYDLLTLPVTA